MFGSVFVRGFRPTSFPKAVFFFLLFLITLNDGAKISSKQPFFKVGVCNILSPLGVVVFHRVCTETNSRLAANPQCCRKVRKTSNSIKIQESDRLNSLSTPPGSLSHTRQFHFHDFTLVKNVIPFCPQC